MAPGADGEQGQPKKKVKKTLMYDTPSGVTDALELIKQKAEQAAAEPGIVSVEAPVKRRVARTMLFTPTPDLVEAAAAAEPPAVPGQRRISTKKIAKTLVFDRDQYIEEPEVQEAPTRKMRGQQYVAKTMLDHSMLFDQVSRSHLKQEEKAIELARERANEPVKPFVPIVCKKKALACPWTWDETYSTERYRYCGKCQRPVYNFAGLEMAEAEAIILKAENRSKFSLYLRTDGKFMTGNCPTAVKKRSDTMMIGLAVVLVVIGLLVYMAMLPHPKAKLQSSASDSNTAAAPGAVAKPFHYVPGSPRLAPLSSTSSGGSSHYDPVTKKMVVDVPAPTTVAAPAPVANTSGPDQTQQDWEFNTPQR